MLRLCLALAAATGFTLFGVACGSSGNAYNSTSGSAPATNAPAASQSGSGSVTVKVSSNPRFGSILTDAGGRTLYLRTNDAPNQSSCTADCAQNWPPLTATGSLTAGSGIDSGLLKTIKRDDGTSQVTLAGQALYYFAFDKQSGDMNGQGVNAFGGSWYLVSPSGVAVKAASAGATPGSSGDNRYPGY